jgi:hypothetical protein
MIRNERGFLTVDFIFAIVMILGFTALLFCVSLTLTVVSVTQYITFAAARNYGPAHIDLASQERQGRAKYGELMADKVFKPLYRSGWFLVDKPEEIGIGDHTKIIAGYADSTQGTNEFWGAGTKFTAKILDFHIPFFGSSAPDSDGSGSGFKTYIGSYLGREPTTQECLDFTAQRWTEIRKLSGSSYSQGTSTQGYYSMTDDGC